MAVLVSCGVLLVDARRNLFLCRVTGTARWDLPKGVNEIGETPRDAAVRETWEESGLRLPADALHDLGEFRYIPAKRLHLFALRVARTAFDIAECRCRSFYLHHRTGRSLPEVEDYAWWPATNLSGLCGKNLVRVLAGLDWAALAGLPEIAAIEVDLASPVGP